MSGYGGVDKDAMCGSMMAESAALIGSMATICCYRVPRVLVNSTSIISVAAGRDGEIDKAHWCSNAVLYVDSHSKLHSNVNRSIGLCG